VDVGTSASAAAFADNINVASTGIAAGTVVTTAVQSTSDPTDVYVVYVPAGSTPTAGAGRVVVEYAFNE
jgi:hypothetical protein